MCPEVTLFLVSPPHKLTENAWFLTIPLLELLSALAFRELPTETARDEGLISRKFEEDISGFGVGVLINVEGGWMNKTRGI